MTAEASAGRGFDGFAPETVVLAGRTFIIRRAAESDVSALVALLRDDVLGAARENGAETVGRAGEAAAGSAPAAADTATTDAEEADPYARAFALIAADPNQLLVAVVEVANRNQTDDASTVVGTLQLSLLPSLSRRGTLRLQIEAVRIGAAAQGIGLGTAVFEWAHECGRRFGAGLAQLTTDRSRTEAQRFYARLGYVASHEGMKLPLT